MKNTKKRKKTKHMARYICFWLVIILAVGLLIDVCEPAYGFIGKVDTGCIGIVTRFGAVKDEGLAEGRTWKPFFDKINVMDLKVQKAETNFLGFSKDIQEVSLKVAINYKIMPEVAPTIFKTIGIDYYQILLAPAALDCTKSVIARYTAEELIEHRSELGDAIEEAINTSLCDSGIIIVDVKLLDIDFSDAFTNAVEAKQVATQEKLRTQTEQEKLTIVQQEEATRAGIKATADAEVTKQKAEAEAYAIKIKAEAEAEANTLINASLTDALIDYTRANRWDGAYPTTYLNANDTLTPMLSID